MIAVPPLATVKKVPVMVEMSIASLKVTVIFEPVAMLVAFSTGTTEATVGAVVSGVGMVEKLQTLFAVRAFPARSFTPVVTVVVIKAPVGSEADGVNVAILPSPL